VFPLLGPNRCVYLTQLSVYHTQKGAQVPSEPVIEASGLEKSYGTLRTCA